MLRGANSPALHYINDPNGCPIRLIDSAGHIQWAARHRAWGGIAQLQINQVDNPLRLQGQYEDGETGLHYNRYRYYAPQIGAFISQDPLGLAAGVNVHDFAPNALGWVDPLGLSGKCGGGEAAREVAILRNGKRGRASEARVLKALGLTKNTDIVKASEGRSIPDALTEQLSVEVKDAANVSLTKQLRIQTEAARGAGRTSGHLEKPRFPKIRPIKIRDLRSQFCRNQGFFEAPVSPDYG